MADDDKKYLNLTNDTHPAHLRKYIDSDVYNASGINGDNAPFYHLDTRADWDADELRKLGCVIIAKPEAAYTPLEYSVVFIEVNSIADGAIIRQITNARIPGGKLTAEEYLPAIVYPLDKDTGIVAYTEGADTYYYCVISAPALTIPRSLSTAPTTSYFLTTDWTASIWTNWSPDGGNVCAAGNATFDALSPTYTLYLDATDVDANVDYPYYEFGAFPECADPTTGTVYNTWLQDLNGVPIRFGEILAVTDDEYVINFGQFCHYGTGIVPLNTHEGLQDITGELVDTANVDLYVNGHYGYTSRVVGLPVASFTTSAGDLQVGDLIEAYTPSGFATTVRRFRKSQNDRYGVLYGVLLDKTPAIGLYFVLCRGHWDNVNWGEIPGLTTTTTLDIGAEIWDGGHQLSIQHCHDGDVNGATEKITIALHGLSTGTPVVYSDPGAAPITGLTVGNTYYIIRTGANDFQLALTRADAFVPSPINLTAPAGGDTHTFTATLAGYATLSRPTYDGPYVAGVGADHVIKRLGFLYYTTALTDTATYIPYVYIQNGINDILDIAYATFNTHPDIPPSLNNVQYQERWENVPEHSMITSTTIPIEINEKRSYSILNPDLSVHIQKIYAETDQEIGATWNRLDYFGISESSFANDIVADINTDTTGATASQLDLAVYADDAPKTSANVYVGPQSGVYVVDAVPPVPLVQDEQLIDLLPGYYGGYRAGDRNFNMCQSHPAKAGLDLTSITLSTANRTLTIVSSNPANTIYLWKDVKTDIDLAADTTAGLIPPYPNVPWVGLMVLAHDVNTAEVACLFSYEGYSGLDTDTLIFYNVRVYTNAASNWADAIDWAVGDTHDWGDATTDHWYFLPMFAGGLRLKLYGTGTFYSMGVKAPDPYGTDSYTPSWYDFKKSGWNALGSDFDTAGQVGTIYTDAAVYGWDMVDDAVDHVFWAGLTEAATFETNYPFDYIDTNTDTLYLSDLVDELGPISRQYPQPVHAIDDAVLDTVTDFTITRAYSTTANFFEVKLNAYTGGGGTVNVTAPFYETLGAPAMDVRKFLPGIRLTISGGGIDLQDLIAYRVYIGPGDALERIYIKAPETTVAALIGNHAAGPYTFSWSHVDNIVASPSVAVFDDKEIWVDTSKKSAYRAYGFWFSIKDADVSDALDITVAQSSFNDGHHTLTSLGVGTELYRYLSEGDTIRCFIKPRYTVPQPDTIQVRK